MGLLDRKVVILTGAAGDVGRAILQCCTAEGASVVATDANLDALQAAVAALGEDGAQAVAVQHDVTSESDWARVVQTAVERFGRVDGLVNCAGVTPVFLIEQGTLDDWNRVIGINATSAFLGIRAALPALRQAAAESPAGAAIVNIASAQGVVAGQPGLSAYAASKGAMRLLSRTAAVEFGRLGYNIRCNVVAPSALGGTSLMHSQLSLQVERGVFPSMEQAIKTVTAAFPLGRTALPADIAAVAAFLLSDKARNITGIDLPVDGGRLA
jgi:NAD(P)-dependent dehydrogenase (short-subunit alcohol dehydrogenase family)